MTPSLLEKFFTAIGRGFSPECYLVTTKIQGLLWSTADIALIYFLLKITDLARADQNARAVWRYRMVFLSATLVPFLALMTTSRRFFILESIIFGLQFIVLIYTLAADTRPVLGFLKSRLTGAED